jgi:MSHA biogenesis protein MshO
MKIFNFQSSIFNNSRGFTLIELVIVIVLLGVLGAMGSDFISQTFKGFSSTSSRKEIYEEGKTALVRMEREIRNAIPNAINRVSATELQISIIDETAMRGVFGRYIESAPTTVINDETTALADGSIISIYNRSWSDLTNTTFSQRRLYTVAGASGTSMPLDTSFKSGVISSSPSHRYYAVDKTIRYYLDDTTLRRSQLDVSSENVDFTNFPVDAAGKPMAKNIKTGSLQFYYTPASLTRNAVVSIQFTLAKGDEEVSFHKEVHIRNVP